jgi:signal peptidase I
MKLVRNILIGLGLVGFSLSCMAVVLFNKPAWGWQALSIPTGSMRPHLPPASLVLVHRVPSSSLRVGDVITYTNPRTHQGTITHRIVKAYTVAGRIPAYMTKGDANHSADAPVVAGLVQGKMVWHIPYVGQAMMWAKTWTGIAVLVYVPALIVMMGETRKLALYWKRSKPYSLLKASNPYHRVISMRRLSMAGGMAVLVVSVVGGLGLRATVSALDAATTNTVTLGPNTLSTGPGNGGGNTQTNNSTAVTCTNTTNVNLNNSSNQSATSGNANNTGSTNGGSATSGSATNTNNSNTSVTVVNGACQQ